MKPPLFYNHSSTNLVGVVIQYSRNSSVFFSALRRKRMVSKFKKRFNFANIGYNLEEVIRNSKWVHFRTLHLLHYPTYLSSWLAHGWQMFVNRISCSIHTIFCIILVFFFLHCALVGFFATRLAFCSPPEGLSGLSQIVAVRPWTNCPMLSFVKATLQNINVYFVANES